MAKDRVFSVGAGVWLPCRVKAGPFPDEQTVLIEGKDTQDGQDWFGVVANRLRPLVDPPTSLAKFVWAKPSRRRRCAT